MSGQLNMFDFFQSLETGVPGEVEMVSLVPDFEEETSVVETVPDDEEEIQRITALVERLRDDAPEVIDPQLGRTLKGKVSYLNRLLSRQSKHRLWKSDSRISVCRKLKHRKNPWNCCA